MCSWRAGSSEANKLLTLRDHKPKKKKMDM
jgi:hypothetical protein